MGHFVTEGNCNIGTMFKSMGSVLKKDRSENNLSWRSEEKRWDSITCVQPQKGLITAYIYDVAMLAVEIQERIENGYLRICLGFPHSFTLIELYNKTIQHQLPPLSVTEEFKSAKSQSRGCRIRQAGSPNTIGASITQYMCIMVRGTNRLCFFYDQYMLPYYHQRIRSKKISWM